VLPGSENRSQISHRGEVTSKHTNWDKLEFFTTASSRSHKSLMNPEPEKIEAQIWTGSSTRKWPPVMAIWAHRPCVCPSGKSKRIEKKKLGWILKIDREPAAQSTEEKILDLDKLSEENQTAQHKTKNISP
jgi:hypothetical protein